VTNLLSPQTKTLQDRAVSFRIALAKVGKEPSALTNQHKQATTRAFIMLVIIQMFLKVLDSPIEDCDLNFRGPGIAGMGRKFLYNFGLFCH
jgi:hypothetical protein